MSVMQRAEQFIDEFRREYKTYNPIWIDKVDGETDLDNLLKNLFSSKNKRIQEIGEEVYQGYEYYRLVRNRFAHSEEKRPKQLSSLFNSISNYSNFYNSKFHSENCPNQYENIDINVFLLITNIIKNIGYTLCSKRKPTNEQLALRIAELKIVADGKIIEPIKNVKKIINNPIRFKNAIGNLLNSTFGRINNTDRDEIINHLKTSILA